MRRMRRLGRMPHTCHQKRIEVGTWPEFGVRRQKGCVDADCEEARHEGVALFSPFRLGYLVRLSCMVVKDVRAFAAIELAP